MATKLILSLSLCLLVLGASAQMWPWQQRPESQRPHQKQRQFQHQCDIQRLTASEPARRVRSEAGVTEFWDQNTPEFRCAGFVALRVVIQPGGLLLPSYTNAPYITFGVIVPGCPETFQSEDSEIGQRREGRGQRGQREQRDQHQKVFRVREGDVIPSPAGVVQWTHNDGDTDLISVTLIDANSYHNQLDQNVRSFYLAGQNQESRQQERHQRRQRGEEESQGRRSEKIDQSLIGVNILSGFDEEILREVFPGVRQETISKIRGEDDSRGFIVQAQDLQLQIPEESEEEEELERERHERRGRGNGLEQSFCNLKFRQNVDRPSRADVFNPRAGRINTINSNSLPILSYLRLSAEHVTLYKNAIIGPRWNLNANSLLYVTRGEGRVQVVGDEGNAVFDDVVQRGQILVVPQGFAVVLKAGREGLQWVELKNNDNAITSPIAGRTSVLRAIPVEVLANAYDIPREEALRFKNGRQEIEIFRPFESREERERERIAPII
ncbi:hypothetical protein V2J09_023218 [Rumex salicifolius]